MDIYKRQDAEATLFNIMVNAMNVYNDKIRTLDNTRSLIKSMTSTEQFEDFDMLYINRWKVKMGLKDETTVSTHIDFFKNLCY